MLIGNKKVSQLISLAPSEVATDDLFLIIDSSNKESKKIEASNLTAWLNNSGSIYAQHSVIADTASFILGSNIYGSVALATMAINSISSSWSDRSGHADVASSSSNATTASFALNAQGLSITSSYLQYSGFPNGTASYALGAGTAETVFTAAYLLYFGGDNGTASYAMFAQSTSFCDTANTASYFNVSIGTVASASFAISASITDVAVLADTASYLQYSGIDNGTASYALVAGTVGASSMFAYGMVEAFNQSISGSIIDNLTVVPGPNGQKRTLIEAVGTVILNFTASVKNDYSLSLSRFNRLSGEYVVMDEATIGLNTTPILNLWGSNATGSLKIPFTLLQQQELEGEYLLEVSSSSPNLQLDTTRLVKFSISSVSPYVDVFQDQAIYFDIQPSSSVLITFTSSLLPGSVAYDYLPGLLITGSQYITDLNIANQGAGSLIYTWECSTLRYLNCEYNSISELKYNFPATLVTLIADNCLLNRVANLDNTTASYIDISYNGLTTLPLLSPSTSYFDCSYNPITALPDTLPTALTGLGATGTSISGATPILPETLLSASFANTIIDSIPNLPPSMSALNVYGTLLTTMSMDIPVSMSFLDVSYALFDTTGLENITTNLVSNAQLSGTFGMLGYGPPSTVTMINNILALQANAWTVNYDL